jgi:predicted NBD/HSP70 family sugar kinase
MPVPQTLRYINEMRVLNLMFTRGPMSRASIARTLNLTRSTTGLIVADLASNGLVREGDSDFAQGLVRTGRPGRLVHLASEHSTFVGADIGVGHLSVLALDLDARTIKARTCTLRSPRADYPAVMKELVNFIRTFLKSLEPTVVRGIGVTVPGPVDRSGVVHRAPIMHWERKPALDDLRKSFPNVPSIRVEKDVNAIAVAEQYRGRDLTLDNAIYVFMDAGVGMAAMSNGQLVRGQDGYAGEFGQIPIAKTGYTESTPIAGSIESLIGREAVLARHKHYGGKSGSLEQFVDSVCARDGAGLRTLADWSAHLGRALSLLTAMYNPERLILAGPVAALLPLCEREVIAAMRTHLLSDQPIPEIALSRLGLEGPALGAASIVHKDFFSMDEEFIFRRGQS